MLINEIEVMGSSIALKFLNIESKLLANRDAFFTNIMAKADRFNLESEVPGLHDIDTSNGVVRGYYSVVTPFEIEHLVEGQTTKTLFKKIESCEFVLSEEASFAFGNSGCIKLLCSALAAATGIHVDPMEFDFNHLHQIQERMTRIKTIVVTNPKEKEIRKARLAGHMESYTEYNIVDPRNHGIESVSGMIDTPLGPLTATIDKKGGMRLNVKKGLVLTVECIAWILRLINSEIGMAAPAPLSTF